MAAQDPNVEFFLRAIEERFQKFKSDFANLTKELCAEDIGAKKKSAQETLASIDSILSIVSQADQPGWLTQFKVDLTKYINHFNTTGASNTLMRSILKTNPLMESHKWSFGPPNSEKPIKFEEIYKALFKESKAPELFSALLETIQKVVDSGEVDSVKAIEALNKLISTIKANMQGTYFQTVGTAHFAKSVLRRYLWKQLSGIPAIGPLVETIKETLDEMDSEMSKVHQQVKSSLRAHAMSDVDLIPYQDMSITEQDKDAGTP